MNSAQVEDLKSSKILLVEFEGGLIVRINGNLVERLPPLETEEYEVFGFANSNSTSYELYHLDRKYIDDILKNGTSS